MSKKKQRKLDFEGTRTYDFELDDYLCSLGPDEVSKWDLEHPSYNKAYDIFEWYMWNYMIDKDNVIETIESHKDRLKKKKEKAEREGLIRNDYDRFFYRFWEELLEYALECEIGDEEGY